MAEYLAKQIINGKLDYVKVVETFPQYKKEIDELIKKYSR